MEKQMIKNVKMADEKNDIFILNYYLTTEKRVYGVFVEKTTGDGIVIEREYVNGVGCVRGQVVELITRLAEHTVTPISLCEVLDDLYEGWSHEKNTRAARPCVREVEKALNKKSDIA